MLTKVNNASLFKVISVTMVIVFIEQTTRAVKVEDEIQESSEEHGYELNGNNLFDC